MADSVAVRIGVLYARGISGVEIAERRGIPVRQVYLSWPGVEDVQILAQLPANC